MAFAGRIQPRARLSLLLLLSLLARNAAAQWTDPVRHNVTSSLAHAGRTIPWNADLDGDTDLLLSYTFADAVYLALSPGDGGQTWQLVLVGGGIVSPYALPFDADCDGDLDVVALGFMNRDLGFESAGKVAWYERPATLTSSPWTESLVDDTLIHASTLDVGDVDRDGDADLLVTTQSFSVANRVLLYENRCGEPVGPRWSRFVVATGADFGRAGSARFADIDRDTWPDVVVADAGGHRVSWFASQGNPRRDAWTRRDVVSDPGSWAGPNSARAVDMDGDTDLDVLVSFLDASAVAWFECPANPLGGSWIAHPVALGFTLAKDVVAGDFDNDGRLDVAAISQGSDFGGTDTMAIFQNDGAGGWIRRLADGNYVGASTVDAGDVDGDGDLDITSASYAGDSADWWENVHPVAGGNTAPQIVAGGPLGRVQGSAATGSTVCTVTDAETAAGNLTVAVIAGGTATGVTLGSLANAGGTITAAVSASCTATSGTVRLRVTDAGSLTATADLTVNVTANTPPTLGSYPETSVAPGAGTTVTPGAVPADNGGVSSLTASAPGFTGTLTGNAGTGAVTVANAGPAGDHTVTVTATDTCGATTQATFTLHVVAGADPCNPDTAAPVVAAPSPASLTVSQSTCAGAAGTTLATLTARDPAAGALLDSFLNAAATAADVCSATTRLPTRLGTTDIAGATVFLPGANAVTFRFADASNNVGTAPGTVFVTRQGDVDLSGVVDLFDLITVQNRIVGNVLPGTAPFTAPERVADHDNDGEVDVFDLVLEASFIVGNTPCLTP